VVAVVCGRHVELGEDFVDVLPHGPLGDAELVATTALERPSAITPRTSRSRERGQRFVTHERPALLDIETSQTELGARASCTEWRNFEILNPRCGGIADLLDEAQRPDRRFDG
jgi:hypothetical protein